MVRSCRNALGRLVGPEKNPGECPRSGLPRIRSGARPGSAIAEEARSARPAPGPWASGGKLCRWHASKIWRAEGFQLDGLSFCRRENLEGDRVVAQARLRRLDQASSAASSLSGS